MYADLTVSWGNVEGLERYERALMALGDKKMRQVQSRAVNRTGSMALTQVRRNLTKQTGLPRRTIVDAVKTSNSSTATLTYKMWSIGGDVALKYFGARETRRGVSAAPFGKREVFEGAFITGGRFPRRVSLKMGDHVFERTGHRRLPIEKVLSGVIIPAEMVTGATKSAFETTAARTLPKRIEHEIKRATGSAFS